MVLQHRHGVYPDALVEVVVKAHILNDRKQGPGHPVQEEAGHKRQHAQGHRQQERDDLVAREARCGGADGAVIVAARNRRAGV